MSLIFTVRLITRRCQSQMLSINFKSINQNIFNGKNYPKTSASVIQIRCLSGKKENKKLTKNDSQLVYHGPLSSKIKALKVCSLGTSFVNLMIQPYLLPRIIEAGSMVGAITAGVCFGFFIFVTPIIIHIFTKKYVIDVYHDIKSKTYTASVYTIFAQIKKIEFTPDDVEPPGMSEMLTNCYIKGRPLLLDMSNFLDVSHYGIIMGYDKPMNFELDTDNKSNSNSKCNVNDERQTVQLNEKKSMRN